MGGAAAAMRDDPVIRRMKRSPASLTILDLTDHDLAGSENCNLSSQPFSANDASAPIQDNCAHAANRESRTLGSLPSAWNSVPASQNWNCRQACRRYFSSPVIL